MHIETFFPYQLAITAAAFSRQLVKVYGRDHGLSREEWRLLFLLADAGGLDSLQIAQRTSLDKVQVSRAATRLEEKGLITREVSGSDRRLRNYAVTPEGGGLFARAFAGVEKRAAEILGALSPEDHAALLQGIAALGRAIEETAKAPDAAP
ncbi:MarR family winged helix-turn-helix transcriptional regulator [Frigidibacter mobilis]|uniref:MarR family transcriptional regulator n=1 Tax=Frigidibacter mobilis TaxID=1335048 RepID=A0A165SSJ4_9RHOB|nr:MarR family transcriptional regulator [Frigidibacter mobilis]AMY70609.1 MarR family transcriptional regulator [Frigidibacter mobilis]